MKYRARNSYKAAYSKVLVARSGARLRYERRPTEYSGWLWCTDLMGKSAWVPESWVELADDSCTLLRDYDSTELSIADGDPLEVELEESGWAWVRNSRGEWGWVPADRIELDLEGDL